MSDDNTDPVVNRRSVIKTTGLGALAVGCVGFSSARGRRGGPPEDRGARGGGPPEDRGAENRGPPTDGGDERRTISWDGKRGSENAELDCYQGQEGVWYWVLTPGGPEEFTEIGELIVTFDDGDTKEVSGVQRGRGAVQFQVQREGGGTVAGAEVTVTGGGRNAALTISDSECVGDVYWQVDFGRELTPPDPPNYEPEQFLMAAVGNSDSVSFNPSCVFPKSDVELVDREFEFDDENEPTSVEVTFNLTGEADLHLAVFTRPPEDLTDDFDEDTVESAAKAGGCPIDADDVDVDEQEEFEVVNGTFSSGEHTLEIDLPTA